jgi:catechol 2,3-dioxygenase-like lactoylglutathione lyase family enzyme
MIHHLSIAARDPKHAAETLAELMGGRAVPFPPNPGSFFALQLDDHGSGVEVYPAGTELAPNGSTGGTFVKQPKERGYGATHFALSVPTDRQTVEEIARRAGWNCFVCNRGPFHVIEVWVENETMVEILPPDFASEYLAFTRPDKVLAAMAAAPAAAGRHN